MDVISKPIQAPFTMIISGQSGAGKTTFVKKILEHLETICDEKFERVLYSYSIDQPLYSEIARIPKVEMNKGFPTVDETNKLSTLIVIDDMMIDMNEDVTVQLFTRLRHALYSTIFLTQNFFLDSKHWRTIARNSNYIVLFKNPRDMAMVNCLGRQMYPHYPKYLPSAFEQATENPTAVYSLT